MLFAALSYLSLQSPPPTVVWEQPAMEASQAPAVRSTSPAVPTWALADPFGYERARCSPMVRGDISLDACQLQVRSALAEAMGDDLPDALRPHGMAGDCQMVQVIAGGSDYGLQWGDRNRDVVASATPREVDCRPRPERGGFTSECRPANSLNSNGLKLRLWGGED